jgi:phage shock protein PspC (stress-responsive transcriptional regulator)
MTERVADAGEPKPLRRSRTDRVLAGVCGGLADFFDLHPAVFRVAFVVLALLGGAGILVYLAAALVMPDEGEEDSVATAVLRPRRGRRWLAIGLGALCVVTAATLSEVSLWPHGDAWVFLLAAGALILLLTRYVVAERGAGRRLAIVAASLGLVLLILAAVVSAGFDVQLRRGVGERVYRPATSGELRSSYELGIGRLLLDLRSTALPRGRTRVRARVDLGELQVIVSDDVALRVQADAHVGEVDLLGKASDGEHVEASLAETGPRVLVLDAHVGLGSVRVSRAVR